MSNNRQRSLKGYSRSRHPKKTSGESFSIKWPSSGGSAGTRRHRPNKAIGNLAVGSQEEAPNFDSSPENDSSVADQILNDQQLQATGDGSEKQPGWYNPLDDKDVTKSPDSDQTSSSIGNDETSASTTDGQNTETSDAEQSLMDDTVGKGYMGVSDTSVKPGLRGGAQAFLGSRRGKFIGGGGIIAVVVTILMFTFFGAGSELISFRENVLGRSPFAKILNFSTDRAARKSFHKSLRSMRAGDPRLKIDQTKFQEKFRQAGFTVEFDTPNPPEKPKLQRFAFGDKELDLNDTNSKRAMSRFIDEGDATTRKQIRKAFNGVQRNEARTFKGKAVRRIYKTLKTPLINWLKPVDIETKEDTDAERVAKRDIVSDRLAEEDAGVNRTGGQSPTDEVDEEGRRTGNGSDDGASPRDGDGSQLDFPDEVDKALADLKENPGADPGARTGILAGSADAISGAIDSTIKSGPEGVGPAVKTSILSAIRSNPKLVGRVAKFNKIAGLISVSEPFRIACRVKGTIHFVSHIKNVVLAAELARFAIKVLTAADHQKAGLLNSEGLRLLMKYLHGGTGYMSAGGMQWLMGIENSVVGSASLSQYSTSRKPTGDLALIAAFLDSVPLTNPTACKIYNNGAVQVATAIIGGILAVFSGGASAAASAAIGFSLSLLEEAVFIVATPIMLKAAIRHVASWYEVGPENGNMLSSGVGSFLSMSGGANGALLSKVSETGYMETRAEADYQEKLADQSIFERYLKPDSADSLFSRVAFALPSTLSQTITSFGALSRKSVTSVGSLGYSVGDLVLDTQTGFAETNSQCNDPKANELGYSTDPFCNPLVATIPDLDLDKTESVLTSNNMIDADGRPVPGSDYDNFIKDCLSGRTGLAYSPEVAKDGTEDIDASNCTKTGGTLAGTEPQTIYADAPLNDTRAWYSKLLSKPAYAQTDTQIVTPSAHQMYSAWFNYREANVEGLTEEINNSYDFQTNENTEGSSNNQVYMIGDSLTVGMRTGGELGTKLTAAGYKDWSGSDFNSSGSEDTNFINGVVGRPLFHSRCAPQYTDPDCIRVGKDGIQQIQENRNKIAASDTVVLALGTNPLDSIDQFTEKASQAIDDIKAINSRPGLRIFWVNLAHGANDTQNAVQVEQRNQVLSQLQSTKGLKIIDWNTAANTNNYYAKSTDGVHPTGSYPEMAQVVANGLGQAPTNSGGSTDIQGSAQLGSYKMDIRRDTATSCSSGGQPGILELSKKVDSLYGGGSGSGYNCRSARGSSVLSVHGEGRAYDSYFDVKNPDQLRKGNEAFGWLLSNAKELGLQYVVFWKVQWSPQRGISCVENQSVVQIHSNHMHYELNWDGARKQTPFFTSNAQNPAQTVIDQSICAGAG